MLKRNKWKKLENENRLKLETHVLIYNKHWKEIIGNLSDSFLLIHVHPDRRNEFYKLFNYKPK